MGLSEIRLNQLSKDFTSTLKIIREVSNEDLLSIIFKSLELGTLRADSASTILCEHGISIEITRNYFYKDPSIFQNYNSVDFDPTSNENTNNNDDNNLNVQESSINNSINIKLDLISDNSNKSNNQNSKKKKKKQKNKNNNNNDNTKKFSEFIAHPNALWNSHYTELIENEVPDDNNNTKLFSLYQQLLNQTKSSKSLKSLPKFIAEFRIASQHLENIFIPRLVILPISFLLLIIFYILTVTITLTFFRLSHSLGLWITF
jgi:hypothetical protein